MTFDIHNHPTIMAFGSSENGPANSVRLHTPLRRPQNSKVLKILEGYSTEAAAIFQELVIESQSDFSKQKQGGVKVSTIVVGSFESGFAQLNLAGFSPVPIPSRVIARLISNEERSRMVQNISGVDTRRIEFIRDRLSNEIDNPSYFTDFDKELNYVLSHKDESFSPIENGPATVIRIPENFTQLSQFHSNGEDNIISILAVEGVQSMGIGLSGNGLEPDYLDRINRLKTCGAIVLYAGLNHHFPNKLGGQPRSFSDLLSAILQQHLDYEKGLTEDGIKVLDALLDKSSTGKRILVDVKHMNLKTRQGYYDYLKSKGENIPIICSHTGVTSSSWDFGMRFPEKLDQDPVNTTSYFHPWTINLFNEDVVNIINSKGLIGIQLDEKRIGGGLIKDIMVNHRRELGAEYDWNDGLRDLFIANVLSIVQTAFNANRTGSAATMSEAIENAWGCIAIGSDFDGVINPIDHLKTAASFPEFRTRVEERLADPNLWYNRAIHGWELPNNTIQILLNRRTAKERTDQIFHDNAMNFLARVLPENGY